MKESSLEDATLIGQLLKEKEGLTEDNNLFCQQYIQDLSSYSFSKLVNEPENLREVHAGILHQTQSLAFENYQTFIQAAECSEEVYKDFNIIEEHLDSVSQNLPKFTTTVEKFSRTSQEINACRKQNSLVLSRHTQLLEILEISQLMDTCVRNGYYEEALELSNYVKRIERKFSSIKIIKDIANEVKRSTQYMLSQLLQQLKGNIQLPACLRIISYVRQLDVFTEPELRIRFLQGRDAWFQSVLSQISKEDAYTHLTKVIDASRVSLFDIITQYKAIFSDSEQSYATGAGGGVGGRKKQTSSSILNSWVLHKLSQFMKTLDEDISAGLHGRLDALYGQCMYFGLSFSRIGADFRGAIVSFFCKHTITQFKTSILAATERFEDDISTYTTRSLKRTLSKDAVKSPKTLDPCIPPHDLLEFSPIAIYLNAVLSAFNEFRQFASLSLVFQVKQSLNTSLHKVMIALENWSKLESQSVPGEGTTKVKSICELVCRSFLPYVQLVFETVFTANSLHAMTGRTPTGFTSIEVKAMFTLDIETLRKVLKDFVDLQAISAGELTGSTRDDNTISVASKEKAEIDERISKSQSEKEQRPVLPQTAEETINS